MPDSNIEILKKKTYIKAIENSVGSKIFNSIFVRFKDSGEEKDILDDGDASCAYFVSGILAIFQLMDRPHATVGTVQKLLAENKEWKIVDVNEIEAGDVIFWKKITYENGDSNAHAGFALSDLEAVSTDYRTRMVFKHLISNQAVDVVYRKMNW